MPFANDTLELKPDETTITKKIEFPKIDAEQLNELASSLSDKLTVSTKSDAKKRHSRIVRNSRASPYMIPAGSAGMIKRQYSSCKVHGFPEGAEDDAFEELISLLQCGILVQEAVRRIHISAGEPPRQKNFYENDDGLEYYTRPHNVLCSSLRQYFKREHAPRLRNQLIDELHHSGMPIQITEHYI